MAKGFEKFIFTTDIDFMNNFCRFKTHKNGNKFKLKITES